MEPAPNFFERFVLAFVIFFRVLFDPTLAGRVQRTVAGRTEEPVALPPAPEAKPVEAKPVEAKPVEAPKPAEAAKPAAPSPDSWQLPALHLLSILQREGRLVDFLEEDITTFPDSDVGAAARVVHEGCKKALRTYLKLSPVMTQEEGATVTVEPGFDASRIRLTGNVVGNPPFKGQLKHKGWKASDVTLPPPPTGMDAHVVAPAEVEL